MRLHPQTGDVRHETLVDRAVEFPRIDDRVLTQRHGCIAGLTTLDPDRAEGRGHDTSGLVRHPDPRVQLLGPRDGVGGR